MNPSKLPQALACFQQGDFAGARRLCQQILRRESANAGAWHLLGVACLSAGDTQEALDALKRARAYAPGEPDIYLNLSNALAARGNIEDALAVLQDALLRWPGHRDAHYNRGVLLQRQRQFDESAQAYAQALKADPNHLDACNNHGVVLENLGRLDEAAACYRKALTIHPRSVHAHSNLAKALRAQGRLEESAGHCLQALQTDASFADALLNLAGVRAEQGDNAAALQGYQQVLAADPDDADAHLSYGMLCLGLGHFAEGWRHYSWRAQRRQMLAAGVALDDHLPAEVSGQRILLIGEQGLGDELFFLRYAPLLRERGARLLAFCDPKIAGIVQRTEHFEQVATHGTAPPPSELRLAMGDMPHAVGATACAPPLRLTALPARVEALRARLAALGPPPYIGLTWRAGTPPEQQIGRIDRALFKHVPIAQLSAALKDLPGTWIALQRLPRAGELDELAAGLAREVHDFSALNDDLEDMLALLSLVDDYVGVSNTNMHLLAGVGGHARVLAPNPPEWRWMSAGETSPWFPGYTVYRQAVNGDWSDAWATLAQDMLHRDS